LQKGYKIFFFLSEFCRVFDTKGEKQVGLVNCLFLTQMSEMVKYFYLILFGFFSYLPGLQAQKRNTRTGTPAQVQYGTASFYADKFIGKQTANGDIFSQDKMTAAHNTLPLGTWIRVTNLNNKKVVVVRINDRLHHRNPRLVDLSKSAAKKLGYTGQGLTRVKVEVLGKKQPSEQIVKQ
jgi:rare lipoprotein A